MQVASVRFEGNLAGGTKASGGAVYISDGDTSSFSMSAFLQNQIAVDGSGAAGFGGALHCDSGKVDVEQCNFTNNLAQTLHPLGFATGGAMSIAQAGAVRLLQCALRLNYAAAHSSSMWPHTRSGSHISNSGTLLLQNSNISDLPVPNLDARHGNQTESSYWLVALRGTTLIDDCMIHASTFGTVFLLLGDGIGEALVRGSSFTNASLTSEGLHTLPKLGILNSTFDPPVPSVTDAAQMCRASISGTPVCDPVAQCTAGPTGGVRCDCPTQAGVTYARGVPADGRLCQRLLVLDAGLATEKLQFRMRKPDKLRVPVKLGIRAIGGLNINVSAMKTTQLWRNYSKAQGADSGFDHAVLPYENFTVSRHGLAFNWTTQDPPSESMSFTGSGACVAPREFEFELVLDCRNTVGKCAVDGDNITSIIDIRANEEGFETSANRNVSITIDVFSAASCQHSRTALVPDSADLFHDDAVLAVHVFARDVDNYSIAVSDVSASFNITWQGQKLEVVKLSSAGYDGEYYAEVPRGLREAPGKYELRVALLEGFNETTGDTQPCILKRREFNIDCRSGFNVRVEGAVASCHPRIWTAEIVCAIFFGIASLLLVPFAWTRSWEWRRFERLISSLSAALRNHVSPVCAGASTASKE